jgi:hypothetical protein
VEGVSTRYDFVGVGLVEFALICPLPFTEVPLALARIWANIVVVWGGILDDAFLVWDGRLGGPRCWSGGGSRYGGRLWLIDWDCQGGGTRGKWKCSRGHRGALCGMGGRGLGYGLGRRVGRLGPFALGFSLGFGMTLLLFRGAGSGCR